MPPLASTCSFMGDRASCVSEEENGATITVASTLVARLWARLYPASGRPGLAVCDADSGYWRVGGDLRTLLHVTGRSGATLLLVFARLHGLDAGCRAVRQPDPAGGVLGVDQRDLVSADRLLAPPC